MYVKGAVIAYRDGVPVRWLAEWREGGNMSKGTEFVSNPFQVTGKSEPSPDASGLPSASDLDAVAAEANARGLTSLPPKKKISFFGHLGNFFKKTGKVAVVDVLPIATVLVPGPAGKVLAGVEGAIANKLTTAPKRITLPLEAPSMKTSGLLSILSALGMSVLTALTPEVQRVLAAHPTAVATIGSIIAVIMHFLPSPAA
jgi:hypothetical protein